MKYYNKSFIEQQHQYPQVPELADLPRLRYFLTKRVLRYILECSIASKSYLLCPKRICDRAQQKTTEVWWFLGELFLCFFEDDVLAGFGIVLLELDLARDEFLVLARPVHVSGCFVAQLDEAIL